jgi:predicted metalloprotease with PDZ domain
MIREFARNIVQSISASSEGRKLRLKKFDKHTWQAAPCKGALEMTLSSLCMGFISACGASGSDAWIF